MRTTSLSYRLSKVIVMKDVEIAEVLKLRFRKLLKYYHNLLEDFKAGDIHHFRIEIKKMRAFLLLVNGSAGEKIKIPKALKLFYDETGNMRNLQIHRHAMVDLCNDLKLPLPETYLHHLDDEGKALKKHVRQIAKNLSIKSSEHKLIAHAPERITGEACHSFVKQSRIRLDELMHLSFYTDEALHEVRKIMKNLMYNLKYTNAEDGFNYLPGWYGLKNLNAVTGAFGKYHDMCISLLLLGSSYAASIQTEGELKVLNELKIQLQLRKDVMKIEIMESLKYLEQLARTDAELQVQDTIES